MLSLLLHSIVEIGDTILKYFKPIFLYAGKFHEGNKFNFAISVFFLSGTVPLLVFNHYRFV